MLYTAPSGAVQILLLWIGVAGCWLFPKNRTLVCLVLIALMRRGPPSPF